MALSLKDQCCFLFQMSSNAVGAQLLTQNSNNLIYLDKSCSNKITFCWNHFIALFVIGRCHSIPIQCTLDGVHNLQLDDESS
ncbi:unnamed protein product [Caenorhabditis brenneri]